MAFSLRKMLSNITYFSKPGEEENHEIHDAFSGKKQHKVKLSSTLPATSVYFDQNEADSTSKYTPKTPVDSVKNYEARKYLISDTDVFNNVDSEEKSRKLNLDIQRASKAVNISTFSDDNSLNLENTPKHKLLECESVELFKDFNFNQSFDISDVASVASSYEENVDIESLSDQSDTDVSAGTTGEDKTNIKMCRKVDPMVYLEELPSTTPESFADVEVDRNEEERITLLLNYQMKLEKIECFLKKLLTEFQFHIEVSKIFNCKSVVTTLPGSDVTNIPKTLGNVKYIDNIQRGISPAGWNIIMEKEDTETKTKLKNQLQTMKSSIDEFINTYLQERKPKLKRLYKSETFELHKGKRFHRQNRISNKKKMKHFDFPDLREAMLNLFSENRVNQKDDQCKCLCHCQEVESPTKTDKDTNQSISSSIGNFTLDATTLSAYSESLDQIISYNSFNDSTLFNTLLQKPAIERVTFYIQVHSIQLKSEPSEEFETKNNITFHCPTCKTTNHYENGLLKHILSPEHCEKIHFVYKTAYVKKCISEGKEIQPSTVLNPMTMYRDENKIVCFGDAMYACSLCFENLIVGESILMSHCASEEHSSRREMLVDMFY